MFESCVEIRNHFSDYVDDLCTSETLKSIRFHLVYCLSCREELEGWRSLHDDLRALPRRRVPSELALRLRVRMSHEFQPSPFSQLWVRIENALKPLLIPATGGVLAAVISFCLIMGSEVVRVTNLPDVPLTIVTPPRVRELAPMDFVTGDNPLVVVTEVDAEGRVTSYRVLSGEDSPEVMQNLDRMIYFTSFHPATSFGIPTKGEVVLSLRRITVRG